MSKVKNKKAVATVEDMLGLPPVEKPHHTPKRRLKKLPVLSLDKLEKLSTQRLLQVLKAARACSQAESKARYCDCCGTPYSELYPQDKGYYKKQEQQEQLEWELRNYYKTIKSILSERGNVEKGKRA